MLRKYLAYIQSQGEDNIYRAISKNHNGAFLEAKEAIDLLAYLRLKEQWRFKR